jgi:hypothetical protein
MKNTRDEIMEEFYSLLSNAAMSPEEYEQLQLGNYSTSGETEWSPSTEEPATSGESEWTPDLPKPIVEDWVEKWEGSKEEMPEESEDDEPAEEGWPKTVKMQDGSKRVFKSLKEWREDARKRKGKPVEEPKVPESEPEIEVEVEPESAPEEPKLGLEESSTESGAEYSDEEVMQMIEEDPANVVTNLMLQRKPEYSKFMYPMLKSLMDWLVESGSQAKPGDILYDEAEYMLERLEESVDLRDLAKIKGDVSEIERMLDEQEQSKESNMLYPISKRAL